MAKSVDVPLDAINGEVMSTRADRRIALRLLVIEDDPDLNRQLATALTDAGYVVDRAFDGEEGHYLGETEPYDAVILDIGLPKMDGISVLEAWRRAGRAMPVLMLTARDRWSDKVQGFDAGADDYVAKPFHLEEVLARMRALLRRSAGHAKSEFNCGPVRLDTRTGPQLNSLLAGRRSDEAGPHTRKHLLEMKWLGNVVVGSASKPCTLSLQRSRR